MGQIIAIVSGKGGTGKTSLTALIGVALASLGKKTLLLDCDVGLRALDIALGLTDKVLMDFSDVAARRATLEEAVVRHETLENLYLLTAPVTTEASLQVEDGMREMLSEVREKPRCQKRYPYRRSRACQPPEEGRNAGVRAGIPLFQRPIVRRFPRR